MARPQLQDEVTQISGTLKWITGPKFIKKKNMSRNPQICHPKSNHPMNDFSKLFFFFHRQTGRPTRQMLNAWGEEVREEDLDQFPMEMMSKKGI